MTVNSKEQTLLSMRGISKAFPGVQALDGVDFTIGKGEIHALIGENGAGKSTLMKILSGLHKPDSGFIFIQDKEFAFSGPKESEAAGVAMIHQELSLFPELSVVDNLFLGREVVHSFGILDKKTMKQRARELLARLDLEEEIHPDMRLGDLSLGRRQEMEILKALSLNAKILVMDEPTSALSESEVERLFRVVRHLSSQGVGVIYITHRMDEVFDLCTKATVLRDGQLVGSAPITDLDRGKIIKMMVGREEKEFFSRSPHEPGKELFRLEGGTLPAFASGRPWLVKDISFSVRAGEVVGIAGLLGAGRTELLEGIFGAYGSHFQGRLFLEGKEVSISNPSQALDVGLALVTEDRARLGIFSNFSVGRNISISSLDRHVKGLVLSSSSEEAGVVEAIKTWNVKTPRSKTMITALSGGNQQKAILARWMLTAPRVVFLDEPTRGIDVGAKSEIYKRIDDLAKQGLAIVVVSSELPELLALADRVLVLCEGRLTEDLNREEATPERVMAAAAPGGIKT